MHDPESFVDVVVERGNRRVTWEYIGEGESGDYDPRDPDDTPLLRFSCDRLDEDFNPGCESGGASPWIGMEDASYCTYMPATASIDHLLRGAGVILEAIDTDGSYRRRLQELSWLCRADFEHDEVTERRLFSAGYGHGCADTLRRPVVFDTDTAYSRWVENGRK